AACGTSAARHRATQSAGMGMISPTALAAHAPRSSEIGNGTLAPAASRDNTKPPVPANAAWASEPCPAKRVSSTSDRLTMAMIIDVMIPNRYASCVTTSATTTATIPMAAGSGRHLGTNAAGSSGVVTLALVGRFLPNTNNATITTTSGTTSLIPEAAQLGHHEQHDR